MAPFIQNLIIFTLLLLLAVNLYCRYRKLKHIPGPFLASFTDLWRAYAQNFRPMHATFLNLHEKYGFLVRIGPNSISISDPDAVNIIYSNHGEFKKAESYWPMRVPTPSGKTAGSIIDMQDEEQITALKRGVGSAFAMKAMLDYEHDLDDTATELIQTIQLNPQFDLLQLMQFFQLDFLAKIAFSKNFGHLKQRTDVWGVAEVGRVRVAHWIRWQPLPHLEHVIFKCPLWSRYFTRSSAWVAEALSQLRTRESASKESSIVQNDLLQRYLDGRKKYPAISHDTIAMMTMSTIAAGSDTTAFTITCIIFILVTHPGVLAKLTDELEKAHLSAPIPQWSEVNKLEYLDAVLKEAIRCNPFLPLSLERVVPAGGAMIAGTYVPEGTNVGCVTKVIHMNRELFGQDADQFRPERWLVGPEKRMAMERASLGFGAGKRACIGRHIAELEIKKVIPALVTRFKFKMGLLDPNANLDFEDGLTPFPKPIFVKFEEN